jgi:hypothetical protein
MTGGYGVRQLGVRNAEMEAMRYQSFLEPWVFGSRTCRAAKSCYPPFDGIPPVFPNLPETEAEGPLPRVLYKKARKENLG